MSQKPNHEPDDAKDFPEWLTELKDDDDDPRELRASKQESQDGWRFEPFPDDVRREREQRRENSGRYDLE